MAQFSHIISAVDLHTGGEPARVVLSGLPPIHGRSLAEKKQYMASKLDHFRTLLLHEPRGHRDMFGVVLVPPTTGEADYGLLFLNSAGYIDMCGHSVMAAATALIETGAVAAREPETTITFDTPAGPVASSARVDGCQVTEVSISNVTCFLFQRDIELNLPEFGRLCIDVAFGGNFFALASAEQLGISVRPENYARLVELGMAIKDSVNHELEVRHPAMPHIAKVGLTKIHENVGQSPLHTRSIVVFGHGQVDRCPCGTGTSAAMAMMHGKGQLPLDTEVISESIIGTQFKGRLTGQSRLNGFSAVHPLITGSSYVTGLQRFVVDPNDHLKFGFMIGNPSGSPDDPNSM